MYTNRIVINMTAYILRWLLMYEFFSGASPWRIVPFLEAEVNNTQQYILNNTQIKRMKNIEMRIQSF